MVLKVEARNGAQVYDTKVLELLTKVELDTTAGVMRTTMRNVSQLMGVTVYTPISPYLWPQLVMYMADMYVAVAATAHTICI